MPNDKFKWVKIYEDSGFRVTGEPNAADARRFKKAAREYGRKHCSTPEAARKKLVELGINNPDGTLTENYRC